MFLDRSNRMPLYYQIYDILLAKIESEEWRPGDKIPSELDLSIQFNVSRTTVKQAIEKLAQKRYLFRQQGKGTFVSKPSIAKQLNEVVSFSEEMLQRGKKPSTKILEIKKIKPTSQLMAAMNLKTKKELIRLKRLRLADEEIMGIQTSYLLYEFCSELTDSKVVEGRSLYKVLEELYGWRPARAVEEYRIVWTSEAEAKILGFREKGPVFGVWRWTYRNDDFLIEYVESLLSADRYTLYIEMGTSPK